MKIKSLLLLTILSLLSFSAFAEIVNLNKSDAATFQHYLKGIGQKKAENIVKYRTEHKEFKTIEEIMEVKGIGEGIFNKIKKDLSLTEGVTTVPAKKDGKNKATRKTDSNNAEIQKGKLKKEGAAKAIEPKKKS